MPRRLYIPDEVRAAIREHIKLRVDHAVSGFLSAHEDEDVLTGDLGSALRSGMNRVFVDRPQAEIPGEWKWSITYYKFRGRGRGATERVLGADGVFELNLVHGSRSDRKSLLFQSKVSGEGGRKLWEQCIKLTTWREAAFILVYAENGHMAVTLDDAIAAHGRPGAEVGIPLSGYLGTNFLDCDVGDLDLHYDARGKRLIWRAMNGEIVATQFKLNHRVAVHIEAPRLGNALPGIDRLVRPEDLHEFRMRAEETDILGLPSDATRRDIRTAKRRLALAYHTDRLSELDVLDLEIMKRRMQEFNAAFDRFRHR